MVNQNGSELLFNGVFAASLVPMRPDLSCDDQELARHCHDLMARGCRGIALFGTTGEGASFSVEERKQVMKNLIASGMDPQRLILGICCSAIQDAVSLAQAALEANCLGVLVVPPFFYKNVSNEGVIAFYREMIQRTCNPNLRLILYHIPQFSGVPLNLPIIQALREEFPDIVIGMKDSEGNLSLIKEVLTNCPGFKIFAGREYLLSEAVQLGAVGGISGIANVFPELLCSLYEYGRSQEHPNRNLDVKRILEVLQIYPIFPALKSIMEHKRGERWNAMRPPLIPLTHHQRQALFRALASLEIFSFKKQE
jgi:4-hydroxy-tetrahydrodipicolinate synthase